MSIAQNRKARVFISCGQRKNTDEVEIAEKIRELLELKGFDPYVAVREQTLRGLKENIFKQLSSSEYFLFIDFKREQFKGESVYRGSLFSHQELAVASFLEDIELMAFRENGVKSDDGILRFLQE
jgi:cobalamin biosynthesis protein CbiG